MYKTAAARAAVVKKFLPWALGNAVALPAMMDVTNHGFNYDKESMTRERVTDAVWNSLFGFASGAGASAVHAKQKHFGAGLTTAITGGALPATAKELMRTGKRLGDETTHLLPEVKAHIADANNPVNKYIIPGLATGATVLGAYGLFRAAKAISRAADNKDGARVQMKLPQRSSGDTEATVDIPLSESGISPTLMHRVGTDARRKLRREVQSRIMRRGGGGDGLDDDDEDEYGSEYPRIKSASAFLTKMANSPLLRTKGVSGGFTPLQMPQSQAAGKQPLETAASKGGGTDGTPAPTISPVDANKQNQVNQMRTDLELQKGQLELQKMQAEINSQYAEQQKTPPPQPVVAPAVSPTDGFSKGLVDAHLKSLNSRVGRLMKTANVFDDFKKWDDNAGLASANTALSLAPGTGNVMSGMRAINAARDGNWGQALWHGVGAIPGASFLTAFSRLGKSALTVANKGIGKLAPAAQPLATKAIGYAGQGAKTLQDYAAAGAGRRVIETGLPRALGENTPDTGLTPTEDGTQENPFVQNSVTHWNTLTPKFASEDRYNVATPGKVTVDGSPSWDKMKSLYGDRGALSVLNTYGDAAKVDITPNIPDLVTPDGYHGAFQNFMRKTLPSLPIIGDKLRARALSLLPRFAPEPDIPQTQWSTQPANTNSGLSSLLEEVYARSGY